MKQVHTEQKHGLHPWWGLVVVAIVLWHGLNTAQTLGTDYLFSLCYLTNLVLAAGLLCCSTLLIGIGFAWTVIGFPLWLLDVVITRSLVPSSLLFHTGGLFLGFYAARHMLIPRWLILTALPVGLFSCLLARLFTDPQYNINAVFRIQQGWEWLFPNFLTSYLAQVGAYALILSVFPQVCNRFVYKGVRP
jgi:hypothetical protein